MKKCKKCQCPNEDEAMFCRNCGMAFPTGLWWREKGLMPVRDFKLKNNLALQFLYWVLLIPGIYLLDGMLVMGAEYSSGGRLDNLSLLFLFVPIYVFLLIVGIKVFLKYLCRGRLRRNRKELLDGDFVERKARNARFAIFARGDKNNHKFGLFDTKKVRVVLSPEYDTLSWDDDGNLLKATKNGKQLFIDVKGNVYEV